MRTWLKIAVTAVLACGCYHMGPAEFDGGPADESGQSGANPDDLVNELEGGNFTGVDLLLVVDNSGSMSEEQSILATSILGMINSLTKPLTAWAYPPVTDMRVAVISSDLGLQYGDTGSTEGFPYTIDVQTCTDSDPKGDNGIFENDYQSASVFIGDGQIDCDEGGDQCPAEFACEGGKCFTASGEGEVVNCPSEPEANWFETDALSPNSDLALQTSCMAGLGTQGCGVEQQLEAAVKGLYNSGQTSFIKEDHVLAVIIVSDENDCSIENPGLFETDEWMSGTAYDEDDPGSGLLNVACHYPELNEENFLFSPIRYKEKLLALKGDDSTAVFFSAIVGVPNGEDSVCQGTGDQLNDCLVQKEMQLEVTTFEDSNGNEFKQFAPACTRDEEGVTLTMAHPGRRYVEVAQDFGSSGYVYSICNADWSPAMMHIADKIAKRIFGAQQ